MATKKTTTKKTTTKKAATKETTKRLTVSLKLKLAEEKIESLEKKVLSQDKEVRSAETKVKSAETQAENIYTAMQRDHKQLKVLAKENLVQKTENAKEQALRDQFFYDVDNLVDNYNNSNFFRKLFNAFTVLKSMIRLFNYYKETVKDGTEA
jgi:hypothetical protein